MTELKELIDYWSNSYQISYINRLPITNQRILDTIRYLVELHKIKGGTK